MGSIPSVTREFYDNHEQCEIILKELREEQCPYFNTDDIVFYLSKNNGDINATIYEMLIIKSEDSSITVSGLTTGDTSAYFKRLASRYKPYNSRILPGG